MVETDNEIIEIEVNSGVYKELHPRNMAYLCNLYINQTEVSKEYSEATMVTQINLTYGLSKKHEPIRIYKVTDDKGNTFVKNFQILELNMDYYHNLWYDKNRDEKLIDKNKLLIMLNLNHDDLELFCGKYKGVKRYIEEIDRLNKLATFKNFISYEEDQEKIYNSRMREAREKGLEQGIEQEKINITKNLLNKNMSLNDISDITGLSIEKIKEIKNT